MATLDEIRRIAEVEFASIVTDAAVMGVKLRFHNGSQDAVEAPSFSKDVIQGFRDFMGFVDAKMVGGG